MKNILHRLHQKPEEHRKAVALIISLAITLMIFGIWLSTLPARINVIDGVAQNTQKQLEDGITPLATAKDAFGNVLKGFDQLKKIGAGQLSN